MGAVILSLCYHLNKVGAAYYNQDSTTVHILHDISEDFQYRSIRQLFEEIQPSVAILSKTQDASLLSFLSQLGGNGVSMTEDGEGDINEDDKNEQMDVKNSTVQNSGQDSEDENVAGQKDSNDDSERGSDTCFPFALHLMPKVAYDLIGAKKRICVLFEASDLNVEENFLRLALHIDMSSVNMVRALGALLKYLDAVRLGVEFEEYAVKTPVVAIKVFTIDQALEMDASSFEALQIFQKELHPSASKACYSSGAKEGISLFRICDRCKSKPGKALLREWFERPTINRETLLTRQKTISFFVQDCNADSTDFIFSRVKHVHSLKGVLKRAKGGRLSVNDWKNVYSNCANVLQVVEYIKLRELRLTEIAGDLENHSDNIARVCAVVTEVIDFRESNSENRLVVNKDVDAALDKLKDFYGELPEMLTKIAKEEAQRLSIEACSVVYVPMFGYLLAIPSEVDVSVRVEVDLQLVYELPDENLKYMKSNRMRELDEQIGDVKMEILDIETTTMLRLQEIVCKYARSILRAIHICASLECCISLALTAREYDWHCPTLVDVPVIDVEKARHPIAELLSASKFVSNPIRSGGAQTKVKLVIGPNASGKSVYLKQVGIIAFLAHVGSFVPADRAVIGPINCILTRMHTVDCVLDGMSSFAKDVAQMAACLQRSSAQSLIIIDEFGKGTLTEVGLSLLASSLNYWIEQGRESCPHMFVSSHFHSLVNLLHKNTDLLSYHTLEVNEKNGQLEFLYQLVDGVIDCSFAIYTAEVMEVPKSVIKRSMEVYKNLKDGGTIRAAEMNDSDLKFLMQVQPLVDVFLDWDFDRGCEEFLNEASSAFTEVNSVLAEEPLNKSTNGTKVESFFEADGRCLPTTSENCCEKPPHNDSITISNFINASTGHGMKALNNSDALDGSKTSILKKDLDKQVQRSRNVSFRNPVVNVDGGSFYS